MDAFVSQRRFIGGILQNDPILNKKHKKFCRFENCTKLGNEYCETHVLLKDQIFCSSPDCKFDAVYESANKPYCAKCLEKLERNEVILINVQFEPLLDDNCQSIIDSKPCEKKRCMGFPGQPALYCTSHSLEGMIKGPNNKCVHIENGIRCSNYATFNVIDQKNRCNPIGNTCVTHKKPNAISVLRKKCNCGKCGGKLGLVTSSGIRKRCIKTNNRKKISV